MKKIYHFLFVSLLSATVVYAQNQTPTNSPATSFVTAQAQDDTKKGAKRGPVFRANKNQITAAQTMLKARGIYSGEATGKLDPATRASIKSYQKDNGLKASGTLNRATLEKMGIALTDKQKGSGGAN